MSYIFRISVNCGQFAVQCVIHFRKSVALTFTTLATCEYRQLVISRKNINP